MSEEFDIDECRKLIGLLKMTHATCAEWLEAACHEIERLRGQLRPSRQDLEDEIDDLREQIDCAIERICDDNFSPTKAATE